MSFNISLHLSKHTLYGIGDPRIEEIRFESVPFHNAREWLPTVTRFDNIMFVDSHDCREVACRKGVSYNNYRTVLGNMFNQSWIWLTSSDDIAHPFKDMLKRNVLRYYGIQTDPRFYGDHTEVFMDLNKSSFSMKAYCGQWYVPWISLITYFVKYGEFLWELAGLGTGDVSLDDSVDAILDSWSGEVGFHTALGLWLFAKGDRFLIQSDDTSYSGISSYISRYHSIMYPEKVFEFISEYGLNSDRLSKRFIDVHKPRMDALGLAVPLWYSRGGACNGDLSDSPEWMDWMGYDDHVLDDYVDEDDYDFEEDW